MAYVPSQTPVAGEDGDSKVMREATTLERAQAHDLEGDEVAVDAGTSGDASYFIAEETRSVFRDMLDNLEPHICEAFEPVSIVSPVVEYSGHQIYKSTLVSQLNGNPFLSKDRLACVKNSIYFNNSEDYLRAANCANTQLLGLGSDCAVFFVQRTTLSKL
jgi:hypothetical protein